MDIQFVNSNGSSWWLILSNSLKKAGTSKITEYKKNIRREFAPWFQGIHFSRSETKSKKERENIQKNLNGNYWCIPEMES